MSSSKFCFKRDSIMDVRQLAFLAGLPAAAVKKRERFWGMPKRGLAFLLANVMFWQPIWAQADGIVVASPGTSLGQARHAQRQRPVA
jgi:filamentous hemagglutinin